MSGKLKSGMLAYAFSLASFVCAPFTAQAQEPEKAPETNPSLKVSEVRDNYCVLSPTKPGSLFNVIAPHFKDEGKKKESARAGDVFFELVNYETLLGFGAYLFTVVVGPDDKVRTDISIANPGALKTLGLDKTLPGLADKARALCGTARQSRSLGPPQP